VLLGASLSGRPDAPKSPLRKEPGALPRLCRAAAIIALTGAITGIHAAPAEAVQANRVNRYLDNISVTSGGPMDCGRLASSSKWLISVPRFSEKDVQLVRLNCWPGNRQVKFVHTYYSQWNNGFWTRFLLDELPNVVRRRLVGHPPRCAPLVERQRQLAIGSPTR
jgi:hypothetical protein